MPAFEPTAEQREIAYKASGFGLPQTDICCLIKNPRTGKSIDQETLRKHLTEELEEGRAGIGKPGTATIALYIGSRNAKHESHTKMARPGMAAPQPR